MRHIVNFGLLFCFTTLATTGVLSFVLPFSLSTTRIHIVFGLATMILVGLHLAVRVKYFRSQLAFTTGKSTQDKSANKISSVGLILVIAVWALLLAGSLLSWSPTRQLVDLGYESRHRREIVRASDNTGFLDEDSQKLVSRRSDGTKPDESGETGVQLNLRIEFSDSLPKLPTMAVWTESTTGSMIETLFIDESVAFSDKPVWSGTPTAREQILPIWRHRYTLITGLEPDGKVDSFTGATAQHSFSLDDFLVVGKQKEFVLCVEVNLAGDSNSAYPGENIGQPSLLYTALVEVDSEQAYSLLELTGHGGGAEKDGAIRYDLDNHSTAKEMVELILAKAEQQPKQTKKVTK